MAGIGGIITKKSVSVGMGILENALPSIMQKLFVDGHQQMDSIMLTDICFGNVAPISYKANENFVFNSELKIYCIVDGMVYIDDSEKFFVRKTYNVAPNLTDNEYIPWLYYRYNANYVKHITGWYNIFICDAKKETGLLSNDRIGLLPLYYYESDSIFIFASKIESILASGLMPKIEFDSVTFYEHLLFNYPVSSKTFIKNISTLSSGTQISFSDSIVKEVYWNPGELVSSSPLSKNRSLDLINDVLKHVINKSFRRNSGPVGATLTGGWDGRLVLSYMLPEYRVRLRVFSFGAETSPDIKIPLEIAEKEGFVYTPYILNQDYIDNSFISSACKTIMYSNGLRSYKRSHYLFAAQQLVSVFGTFISGNFGDEMFKFAKFFPSEVISTELISLVESGFKMRPNLSEYQNSPISAINDHANIKGDLYDRLDLLEKEVAGYKTISEKFQHLKLTRIAGRYFGTELNSYNDYINNFSPFLDFDFISAFSQTSFSGTYYPFNGNKLKHKELSSMLYAELIKRNQRNLLQYNTDKGFSMSDMTHPWGKLAILYKKKFNKKPTINDPYFLDQTETLFTQFCESLFMVKGLNHSDQKAPMIPGLINPKQKDKIISLLYWMNMITKEYSL